MSLACALLQAPQLLWHMNLKGTLPMVSTTKRPRAVELNFCIPEEPYKANLFAFQELIGELHVWDISEQYRITRAIYMKNVAKQKVFSGIRIGSELRAGLHHGEQNARDFLTRHHQILATSAYLVWFDGGVWVNKGCHSLIITENDWI